MSKVKVASFGMSIDGFSAGPRQSLDDPLGVGGPSLMQWLFPTRTFQQMHGDGGGETGIDDDFAARGFANVGAWILGRNMFGPVRRPWPDESWKGWWGDEPPYHVPVYVLTHHARDPIEMQGGTTFHFITSGIHATLNAAENAAGDRDVRIGGGADTVRQYLRQDWWKRCTSRCLPHCWPGGGLADRHRSDGDWLQVHRARCLTPCDARHPVEIEHRARQGGCPVSGKP